MSKHQIENLCWREVSWQRPFKIEDVWEALTHLSALSPRGAVIWECRGKGGHVTHLLGADRRYIDKTAQAFRAHGDIQFREVPGGSRMPVRAARELKITKPVLSLNTNLAQSVIRAGLAAMTEDKRGTETVLQVVLGRGVAPSPVPANLPDPHATWLEVILGSVSKATAEAHKTVREKAEQHGFEAAIRIGVSDEKAIPRLRSLLSALKVLESSGVRIHDEAEAPNGGTAGRAPLGYINIRRVDDRGREERTVVLDEERAPLVKLAFEEYATGNWTVADLAEHLAMCGLTTRATPRIPSAPIDKKSLNNVLTNPYYTGVVNYKGVEYAGNHPALVDRETWQNVQDVIVSHVNGERTREHPHFLKGSLYCHSCGSRMFINYTKSRSGVRYPYFVCGGRHNKVTNCKQRAVLIDEVERKVEQIYDHYSFPPAVREYLENFLQDGIQTERQKYEVELDGLRREKDKLEHQRKKLLEAHYNDAIPLDLMRSEQQKITKQLAAIEHQLKAENCAFDAIIHHLHNAMELIEDCGRTYRMASDHIKRMMNQAIFSKLWVEKDGDITAEFSPLFKMLTEPVEDAVSLYRQQKTRDAEALTGFLSAISTRIQKFFGGGWSNDLLCLVDKKDAVVISSYPNIQL